MSPIKTFKGIRDDPLRGVLYIISAGVLLAVLGLFALGAFRFADRNAADEARDAELKTQQRTDCARVVADETNAVRDRAEKANRDANRAFGAIIVYAIRNPSPPGTVSPEVQALNDAYDAALVEADEAEMALERRLKRPNAQRVKQRCPSV